MPPRRRRTPAKRSVPKLALSPLPVNGLLDWGTSKHWDAQERPCRYCGTPTHLRDDKGIPADKVCAEASLADIGDIVRTYSAQGQMRAGARVLSPELLTLWTRQAVQAARDHDEDLAGEITAGSPTSASRSTCWPCAG